MNFKTIPMQSEENELNPFLFSFGNENFHSIDLSLFHHDSHSNHGFDHLDPEKQKSKEHKSGIVESKLQLAFIDEVDRYIDIQAKNYKSQTRKDKLNRYLLKKSKRVWNKKVSYQCRQKVAKNRCRVRGRFASNIQPNIQSNSENMFEGNQEVK